MPDSSKEILNALSLGKPLASVGSSLIRAGTDFWMRSVEIGARNLSQAVATAIAPSTDTTQSDNAVDAMIEVYRQYLTEMAAAPGAALHRFREELDSGDEDKLLFRAKRFDTDKLDSNENKRLLEAHGIVLHPDTKIEPTAEGRKRWIIQEPGLGRTFTLVKRMPGKGFEPAVDGESRRDWFFYGARDGDRYIVPDAQAKTQQIYRLPARVRDASQGFAVYRASRDLVQDLLDTDPVVSRTGIPFRAWDIGADRTPIALFMVDYRDSDLGAYREFGVACFIAPQNDPLAIGMYLLGLYVDDRSSMLAGRQIWGYPKEQVAAIDIQYAEKSVTCTVDAGKDSRLKLSIPRGGSGTSSKVPLLTYTVRSADDDDVQLDPGIKPKPDLELLRTTFIRSGSGEMIRSKPGSVKLDWNRESAASVAQLLNALDVMPEPIPRHAPPRPILSAWTERMSGEFGVPGLAQVKK